MKMPQNMELRIQEGYHIPQRVIISIFGFFAIIISYTMRFCLDIALMHIGKENACATSNTVPEKKFKLKSMREKLCHLGLLMYLPQHMRIKWCPQKLEPSNITTDKSNEWSQQMQTAIHVSFYVGYVLVHVPGGILADKYGGKWVLAIAIAFAAVLTIVTPLAIKIGGPIILILVRFLLGLSEGPIFPAISALLAEWIPTNERGTLGVLVLSGGQIAISVVNIMSSLLLHNFEWSLIFYFFGGCALIWFTCFTLLCYSEPESNPFITEYEKQYLQEKTNRRMSNLKMMTTPWRDMLTNPSVWALVSSTVQFDWTQTSHNADISKVMGDVKALSQSESLHTSIKNTAPYILSWLISLTSGVTSDLLINYNVLSITTTRRVMATIAAIGPNFLMSLISCFTCSETNKSTTTLINCAFGVMGTYYAGVKITPLDMSPNYAGTLMGIANGLGSLNGIVEPYLKDIDLKQTPFNELRAVFGLVCSFLTTGEIQEFNDPMIYTINDP